MSNYALAFLLIALIAAVRGNPPRACTRVITRQGGKPT